MMNVAVFQGPRRSKFSTSSRSKAETTATAPTCRRRLKADPKFTLQRPGTWPRFHLSLRLLGDPGETRRVNPKRPRPGAVYHGEKRSGPQAAEVQVVCKPWHWRCCTSFKAGLNIATGLKKNHGVNIGIHGVNK